MTPHIIEAKEQIVFFTRREKVASRCVPDNGKIGEKAPRFRVILGTYMEFDDGWTVQGPDGRIHTGSGTVVRFNYRHGTWSVQRPQRCETNMLGYVFTRQGDPCWLKAERESGFTVHEFRRSFSPGFVKLCEDGHASVQVKAGKVEAKARRVA